MVALASLRLDGVEQRVRRAVLHSHRLSRGARPRRADLAAGCFRGGQAGTFFSATSRGLADLRYVLDVCRRLVAGAVRIGLPLLMLCLTPKNRYDTFRLN